MYNSIIINKEFSRLICHSTKKPNETKLTTSEWLKQNRKSDTYKVCLQRIEEYAKKGALGGYIAGMLETDGDFRIEIRSSNKQIKPCIRLAQQDGPYLTALKDFLEAEYSIKGYYKPQGSFYEDSARSARLQFESFEACRLLLSLMKESLGKDCIFLGIGPKAKQLRFIELLCTNPELFSQGSIKGKRRLVDLKDRWSVLVGRKQLQKKSREHYASVFELTVDETINACDEIWYQVSNEYSAYQEIFESYISSNDDSMLNNMNILNLKNGFLAGIIDGDGSLSITFVDPWLTSLDNTLEPPTAKLKPIYKFSVTGGLSDELLLRVVGRYFHIKNQLFTFKTKNAKSVSASNKKVITKVLNYLYEYPLVSTKKQNRVEVIKNIRIFLEKNPSGLTLYKMKDVVQKIWSMNTSHGTIRDKSFSEVWDIIVDYYETGIFTRNENE